ncbi:hypothetical protein [Oleidesulfovibrio alaskensis]|jgi:hypothetical protein|nr:hypothetical protein [Oleidesulfovibrio alaskensis]MBG0772805.1 hypothetical protein [Oleidesulfovibrio alaskensis]MBL3583749.1 hypothetical protein [Oleidesulfovibrio alaskensis]
MRKIKSYLQHRLNPLHIYCRLRDCGISAGAAARFSALYERYLYRL